MHAWGRICRFQFFDWSRHNAWLTGTTEGSHALAAALPMQKVETTDTAPIGLFAQRAASGDFSLRG
jgi:hypothetical protein